MKVRGVNRRDFLVQATLTAAGAGVVGGVATGTTLASANTPGSAAHVLHTAMAAPQERPETYPVLKKGIQWDKAPNSRSDAERMALIKEAGIDGIEAYPMDDLNAAERFGELAREIGVPVHSITYGGWGAPMSSPDPDVIARGHAEIEQALRTAKAMGADTVLLVPAVVTEQVRYGEAWENSQKNIRPMIPVAEELGVVIAVENVWNRFLLSPLEFANYVDEFDSPWVEAYFDIANVILFGYPQDWIRTLGKRIRRIHVKDFRRDGMHWPNLPYDGDVNWPEVRQALYEIGFTGWGTEEFGGGDEDWLHELSRRMDLFAAGAAEA